MWMSLVHVVWKSLPTFVMSRHAWRLSIEKILCELEKSVANKNWLKSKNGRKHGLGVNFWYVAIPLSCVEKWKYTKCTGHAPGANCVLVFLIH
jgi:hypothetical protein